MPLKIARLGLAGLLQPYRLALVFGRSAATQGVTPLDRCATSAKTGMRAALDRPHRLQPFLTFQNTGTPLSTPVREGLNEVWLKYCPRGR